jgi:hypothetical protein
MKIRHITLEVDERSATTVVGFRRLPRGFEKEKQ